MTPERLAPDVAVARPDAFGRDGFLVLPGLLTAEEAAAAYGAFDSLRARDVTGERGSANERELVRDPRFLLVLEKPALLVTLRAIFGDDLQLLSYDSLETAPHAGSERDWHADFAFCAPVTLCVNVGVYLLDMTDETGPLHVVPGSHRRGSPPPEAMRHEPLEGERKVPLRAGDAVVFDAQLWHTGSRNRSDRPRRAVFAYFGRYWMKRMDAYYRTPLPDDITSTDADPLMRQLFGLQAPPASVHGSDYNADNPRWR
jgi:ectoine hydroxylase-related dioxygenase (phytanoyl-CoA dioxygenase family)